MSFALSEEILVQNHHTTLFFSYLNTSGASFYGHVGIVDYLVSKGSNVNWKGNWKR
jgi:hypothetical protein